MLLKINKVRNLGVFSDFSWDAELPAFERFNVVYGENGTGKTTLSRLFDCLKTGLHEEYPALEFKISSQTGDLTHGTAAARKVRVFSADYVQLNIGQLDGNLKPILVVGEENKALSEALEKDEQELAKRNAVIVGAKARIAQHETARGKLFTSVAATISEATSGTIQRSYRKNNAEAAFRALAVSDGLTEAQLGAHRATLRQEAMDRIEAATTKTIVFGGKDHSLDLGAKAIETTVSSLCGRAVISDAIARLEDSAEIASWVEQGHALHKKLGHQTCQFCEQALPADRWRRLEAHFNNEDQALKSEIERAIDEIDRLKSSLQYTPLPDRLAFYSEFRDRYDRAREALVAEVDAAIAALGQITAKLTEKLGARTTSLPFDGRLNFGRLAEAMSAVPALVDDHNKKTEGFADAKDAAKTAVEGHYLCGIKADVAGYVAKILEEDALIKRNTEGDEGAGMVALTTLEAAIAERKSQISNAHKAGEDLTSLLQTFLGRSELVFESGDHGYRVKRNGKDAKRLSEGERTAIAFIYFIVQLKDQEFDLAEGVVVIDDPVSSLDSSSVYQAFAFLKNAVKDAKQVFLLTHNFSFLRLLINWLQHDPAAKKKNKMYMLVCRNDTAGRHSIIVPLDQALIDHPTEYHFLFKTLANFKGDGTIAECYHIPNVTRKVLETFLDFFVPGKNSLYVKLSQVAFDENKKTAIYKYANDNSHFTGQGFEPGLVQESQKNVTYLLEMIKALAPQHYDGMVAATS
ncbi:MULTISPECIES: AAA family ATPase [unclassified Mesorhizobium]|uniref:AAA family ATPase n=1 Tax=unclassified Mesorhizobium TaxID=325217 RepID=UPI003334E763